MTYDFIVNTENVNEYGYRILTAGIDTEQYERNPVVLFGHRRAFDDPKKVIGRCVKLRKENNELIASIEFDSKDEFAKEVEGKVKRKFIRMSSLYADVKETSISEEFVLPGQTLETVTKCKLVEISIVDIGGNDDALRLSKNGSPIQLQKLNIKKPSMSLKTIALAMGLNEDAKPEGILQAYNTLKLAKETAETKATGFEDELKKIRGAEADTLVNRGVELGLIPEALKATQRKAFDTDHDAQKVVLSNLIADKEKELGIDEKQKAVSEILLNKGNAPENGTLTFDYLQKYDSVKLGKIRDEQPEEYARLVKEYGNGVRHKEQ